MLLKVTEKWQKKFFKNIVTFNIFFFNFSQKWQNFLVRLAENLFFDLATVLTKWWVVRASDRAGPLPLKLMYWHD
jgi:hypothetical protein